ncbi:helix-turn-helix transcriptional regulator [Actinophytocola oryzae]|uniref:helix-turn-helix transcriptional regulator n=1 Tax=Actinophytocola oryzae TaxID=502181 RepID=UPI0014150281|nr:helix-turn-helix transcriptional regulator [Actinophytocola oryzae]
MFGLLEEVAAARTVQALREQVVESLGRQFGFRDTTFFLGPTIRQIFADQRPVVNGVAARMADQYIETFRWDDPFALTTQRMPENACVQPLWLGGLTAELTRPRQQYYMERFLLGHRVQDKMVIPLMTGRTLAGGVGILSRQTLTRRDRAVGQLLARHLTPLLDLQAGSSHGFDGPQVHLSPRQAEVADLVAQGMTNKEVAEKLSVSVDTVKKHLTVILKATRCSTRTQLALYRHSGTIDGAPSK